MLQSELQIKDTRYTWWLLYNQTVFQKSVWRFLDQVARDAKNV